MQLGTVLTQLYAMRNQVDALILTVQEALGQPVGGECPHPQSEPVGNFGDPARKCVACGQVFVPGMPS